MSNTTSNANVVTLTAARASLTLTFQQLASQYPTLVTIQELARILRLAERTVRNQLCKNSLPIACVRPGGGRRPLFRLVDVAAFIDQLTADVDSEERADGEGRRRRGRPTKLEQAVRARQLVQGSRAQDAW